jgi:hypothetical protein
LKSIIRLVLDEIIEEKSNEIGLNDIRNLILSEQKPSLFVGENNAEIEYDKNFDKLCILLNEELHIDAKALTTREFYSSLEFLERRAANNKKQMSNGR